MEKSITVLPEEVEQRLDRVLGRLVPDMGLRGRRRLCELGLALVNGRPAKESKKLREGDIVSIADGAELPTEDASSAAPAASPAPGEAAPLFPEDKPRVIRRNRRFAILHKPAAMHTESLAGKPGDSLQTLLPQLLGPLPERVRLLNRLDYPTSGLVTVALTPEGVNDYQEYQDAGQTEKRYLALLEGEMEHGMLANQKLILKNRERVLVELMRHPDPRRPIYAMHRRKPMPEMPPSAPKLSGVQISFEGLPEATLLAGSSRVHQLIKRHFQRWPFAVKTGGEGRPYFHVRETWRGFEIRSEDGTSSFDTSAEMLCDLGIDLAEAVVRHHSAMQCLHCSAVALRSEGQVRLVVFPNINRAGKSLLAASFFRHGARLFADDLLAVTEEGEGMAFGLPSRLRLPLPATASHLSADLESMPGHGDGRYHFLYAEHTPHHAI